MNYPEHRPRRLRRSRNDRWIGGVCGGIAEYLNMDPTLVRVAVVIIALVTSGIPVLVIYLLMMLLVPEAGYEDRDSIGPAPRYRWQPSRPSQHNDSVWGPAGPPWRPQRDPNIDTSAPQPPRQDPDELFRRAKHPTQPSSGPSGPTGTTGPTQPTEPTAGSTTPPAQQPGPSGDDRPEG